MGINFTWRKEGSPHEKRPQKIGMTSPVKEGEE